MRLGMRTSIPEEGNVRAYDEGDTLPDPTLKEAARRLGMALSQEEDEFLIPELEGKE